MEGKTNVLPNDDSGLDQGVAGVIVESTAGNIFELLVADWFLDFFAHGVVLYWLVLVGIIGLESHHVGSGGEAKLPSALRKPPATFSSSSSVRCAASSGKSLGSTMYMRLSVSLKRTTCSRSGKVLPNALSSANFGFAKRDSRNASSFKAALTRASLMSLREMVELGSITNLLYWSSTATACLQIH